MISIETQVSGSQIARLLCQDPEEMAYFLAEYAEGHPQDRATEIVDCLPYESSKDIVKMLRSLADAVESADQS